MKEKFAPFLDSDVVAIKINRFAFAVQDKTPRSQLPWLHVYVTGSKLTCSNRFVLPFPQISGSKWMEIAIHIEIGFSF